MKAIEQIGIAKALKFVWYGWVSWALHVALPPVRTWMLRLGGAAVGDDTVLLDVRWINLHHAGFRRITIGSRCFIADEVLCDARGGIRLEDDVTVSSRVSIVTHINVGYENHPLQVLYPMSESPVTIRRGAYIGTGAILLPGVTIGAHSVVGAGAVVNKDVPAKRVVVGVPAREVKKLRL